MKINFAMNAKQWIAGAAILLVLGVVFYIGSIISKTRTAFVNTEMVYNNFDLKKKLELQLKTTETSRQAILDSLRFQLEFLSVEVQKPEKKSDSALVHRFNALRDYYFQQQQAFTEANQNQATQYTDQIWTQLNQYIKEFGDEHDYEYIFGANGDGALMYADDAVNITDDVNQYVNNKYQGKP
jgi:outer membrane protein